MTEDKLRILYITTFYPTKDRPHHGIFFRDHGQALAQKHDVAVIHAGVKSFKEKHTSKQKTESFSQHNVFTIHEFGSVLTHRNEKSVEKSLYKTFFNAFDKLVMNWGKPDFIIAQCSLPAGELARQASFKMGIPFGVIEHFSFLSEQIQSQKSEMEAIYTQSSWIATVNLNLKQIIESKFNDQSCDVISNVISSEFQLNRKKEKSESFRWLFVGYNHPKKGIDLLSEVLNSIPELEITLVGEGLEQFVLPKSARIKHIRSANRAEMVELMNSHQALLSTSRVETFGMAIVEALASGLPVVSTKSGGPDQYLDETMGILCELTSESIIKSIQFVQNNPSKYDSKTISSTIIHKFGAQNYIKQIENLIHASKTS